MSLQTEPIGELFGRVELRRLTAKASGPSGGTPAVHIECGARAHRHESSRGIVVWLGSPKDGDSRPMTPDKLLDGLLADAARSIAALRGDFALACVDYAHCRVHLAVDRFARQTLCFRRDADVLSFADRADALADGSTIDPQAIFDYLFLHTIAAPRTVFAGVARLPAAHRLEADLGGNSLECHWRPRFSAPEPTHFAARREQFMTLVRAAVADAASAAPAAAVGAFLSGGTDSSTVAGLLGQVSGQPTNAFSIGFDASGYDEMDYARIAARAFGLRHHEYYVTPADLVAAIPLVAGGYDQPFGNSSVLPAYYCALRAREAGSTRLLAGDGGDELFGGNSRYAKQRLFAMYETLPAVLRHALLEPFQTSALARLPLLSKVSSYVEQARVPMPERLQMYNLLKRLSYAEVLRPEFLAEIDTEQPLALQRETYLASSGEALINRMLAFDWKYTLADNDLPKVCGATRLAGVEVAFPLLDDRLADFSLSLPPDYKLRGQTLRWFFKEALRDFLPEAILRKKKHGFGLPFGVWLGRDAALRALALDSLAGLAGRGYVRPEFIDRLTQQLLPLAPGYYGEMVWILMMLEQWFVQAAAARRPRVTPARQGVHG